MLLINIVMIVKSSLMYMQISASGTCFRQIMESARTQHGSFSLTGVFSLGFTDIPYCDCVGGKCV